MRAGARGPTTRSHFVPRIIKWQGAEGIRANRHGPGAQGPSRTRFPEEFLCWPARPAVAERQPNKRLNEMRPPTAISISRASLPRATLEIYRGINKRFAETSSVAERGKWDGTAAADRKRFDSRFTGML